MKENMGLKRSKEISQMECRNLDRILVWGRGKGRKYNLGTIRDIRIKSRYWMILWNCFFFFFLRGVFVGYCPDYWETEIIRAEYHEICYLLPNGTENKNYTGKVRMSKY